MRAAIRYVLVAVLGAVIIVPAPAAGAADLSDLVRKVQPAVVTVLTYDIHRRASGFGSGFFVDRQGHVVTNYHVVEGAYDAQVRLHDGTLLPVEAVAAEDPEADLVRLTVRVPLEGSAWLPVAGDPPKIAEPVVVVGSPMGLEKTVSEGIVSAVRTAPGLGDFFQISAPISRGSSGGPVLNLKGEVVGVVSFMVVLGQNLNFAIPAGGIAKLKPLPEPVSLAAWTHRKSLQQPDQAVELCREGFQLSVDGQYTKALDLYRSATEKDPTNPTAWHGLGFCYTGMNRKDQAVEAYQTAIRINPENAELRLHLGHMLFDLMRYEDATGAYANAVRIDPDLVEGHAGLAAALTELGRYSQAIESHREVIRLRPRAAPAYFNLAVTLSRLESWDEAVDAYRQTVSIDPENLAAYQNLGVLLSRLQQVDEAVEAYQQAIRIDPDHGPAHFLLGRAYLARGDKASALDEYKILKRIDREMAKVLFEEIYP
jgi:tetratricopeptide (TPR) repeat protein